MTQKIISAERMLSRLREMPMFSMGSAAVSRSPAVSVSLTGMPWKDANSSNVSRVVPGSGVTMARS